MFYWHPPPPTPPILVLNFDCVLFDRIWDVGFVGFLLSLSGFYIIFVQFLFLNCFVISCLVREMGKGLEWNDNV